MYAWEANFNLTLFVWRRDHTNLRNGAITVLVWCARIGFALGAAIAVISALDNSPPQVVHFGN
jgi:hypothetical protein